MWKSILHEYLRMTLWEIHMKEYIAWVFEKDHVKNRYARVYCMSIWEGPCGKCMWKSILHEYLRRTMWRIDMRHCWRSRDELIRDVLLWTPTHGRAKAGTPARTYIQQLCEDMGWCPEDLPRAMNDREEWRERVRDIRATSAIWWWWYYISIWEGPCGEYMWKSILHEYLRRAMWGIHVKEYLAWVFEKDHEGNACERVYCMSIWEGPLA